MAAPGFQRTSSGEPVFATPGEQKYIVCNADEGDSGTFADRLLMEGDPYRLIEGMTIAGLATEATKGYVYLRSEYPIAARVFQAALDNAYDAGLLGSDILGSGKAFDLELFIGAGAYICGEETSLLESLEGKRGEIRVKPPVPAIAGLFGQPTLVHNVISYACVPAIMGNGGDWYANLGVGRSTGTMAFQLAGNIRRGGLVEVPFGITINDLVYGYGEDTRSGRPVRTVQIVWPLGRVPEAGRVRHAAHVREHDGDRRGDRPRGPRRLRRQRGPRRAGPLRRSSSARSSRAASARRADSAPCAARRPWTPSSPPGAKVAPPKTNWL